MPRTDKDIGEAVARLRGSTPQRDVAERMSRRGFKWTQGTVSSIEKGERALKLTEATELAMILGVPVGQFTAKAPDAGAYVDLIEATESFNNSCELLRVGVRSVLTTRGSMGLARLIAEKIDTTEWQDEEAKADLQQRLKEARELSQVTVEELVEEAKRAWDEESRRP